MTWHAKNLIPAYIQSHLQHEHLRHTRGFGFFSACSSQFFVLFFWKNKMDKSLNTHTFWLKRDSIFNFHHPMIHLTTLLNHSPNSTHFHRHLWQFTFDSRFWNSLVSKSQSKFFNQERFSFSITIDHFNQFRCKFIWKALFIISTSDGNLVQWSSGWHQRSWFLVLEHSYARFARKRDRSLGYKRKWVQAHSSIYQTNPNQNSHSLPSLPCGWPKMWRWFIF